MSKKHWHLGYVHTYAFLFGFVFGNTENVQRLCVGTTVFIPFSQRRCVCVFIWIHFREPSISHWCGYAESAHCLSVDRRPKRIEMDAVSNANALVWTGTISPMSTASTPTTSFHCLLVFYFTAYCLFLQCVCLNVNFYMFWYICTCLFQIPTRTIYCVSDVRHRKRCQI